MVKSIFQEKNILFTQESFQNKIVFFKYIAKSAYNLGYVVSKEECFNGLIERENQQSTGFQDGFSIPHCKNDTVIAPTLLCIKTTKIPWDSLDGSDIEVSFVLLIPKKSEREHLKYLSAIARSLIDDEFRSNIKKSQSQSEIYQLIQDKIGGVS